MKKLGLIGGTSWHSTMEYYRSINQLVNDHFGDNTNPPLILYNLNQSQIHQHQRNNEWDEIAEIIADAAKRLIDAGAEALMLCANTPHKVYDEIQAKINRPILHIADATAIEIKSRNIKKVCFLGTMFSMEEDFVTGRISQHGIEVLVPEEKMVIQELHRIIQQELTYGTIKEPSKKYVISTIQTMSDMGAEGVILGCTEFPLMIFTEDLTFPIFNTVEIHSAAAVNYILER